MNTDNPNIFVESALDRIAAIRASLLIVAQNGGSTDELAAAANGLRSLKADAESSSQSNLIAKVNDCEIALDELFTSSKPKSQTSNKVLDLIARIEAALLKEPIDGTFIEDVGGFVDSSFSTFVESTRLEPEPPKSTGWFTDDFEIDEETLDIFREEAADLVRNIENDLANLTADPSDRAALWEIRRSAHTFKGAAGIVGLKDASSIAHRLEDLLDKLVENGSAADRTVIALIERSVRALGAVMGTQSKGESLATLEPDFTAALENVGSVERMPNETGNDTDFSGRATSRVSNPIVRVSLDRLDELAGLANKLIRSQLVLENQLAKLDGADHVDLLKQTLADGRSMAEQLHYRLLQIRMQRFDTLETRFNRTVHVTCQEENKAAALKIVNGETEIDTLLVDALVEPLLHLLKNSVVHGIESTDTRRLIGKPEIGSITVSIARLDDEITLSVSDDGRGISAGGLKEKAVAAGLLTSQQALSLDDRSAFELVFNKGLTTADALNLNAGRGIGMSIVKEAIEMLGGRVEIDSTPQRGTTFRLTIPTDKRSEPASNDQPPAKAEKPEQRPLLVLVVDDSASIRRHTAKIVENSGGRVITAIDGVEAIEILLSEKWQPDLILSDVEMPRMDGWDLLSTLKDSYELNMIPVVMVTSLDAVEHKAKAIELGAADYVIKPLDPSRFENIIRSIKV